MEDARKEAGRWFCSPSCLLQGSPGKWKHETRPGPVRRFIKRTLIVLGALVVVGVAAAVLESRSHNTTTTTRGVVSQRAAPAAIPLHRTAGVWKGWRLQVTSVTPKALQLLGPARRKTPSGGQDVMVSVEVKYTGSGYGHLRDLLKRLYVAGSHNVDYQADGGDLNCTPRQGVKSAKPLNEMAKLVFPRRTVRGHLCFLIAKNDAEALTLDVDRPGCNTSKNGDNCEDRLAFRLH